MLTPKLTPITNRHPVPTRETLTKIANGLGVPPEEAFKAAGHFSIETEKFEELEPFLTFYVQLKAKQKEEVRILLIEVQNSIELMIEEV